MMKKNFELSARTNDQEKSKTVVILIYRKFLKAVLQPAITAHVRRSSILGKTGNASLENDNETPAEVEKRKYGG